MIDPPTTGTGQTTVRGPAPPPWAGSSFGPPSRPFDDTPSGSLATFAPINLRITNERHSSRPSFPASRRRSGTSRNEAEPPEVLLDPPEGRESSGNQLRPQTPAGRKLWTRVRVWPPQIPLSHVFAAHYRRTAAQCSSTTPAASSTSMSRGVDCTHEQRRPADDRQHRSRNLGHHSSRIVRRSPHGP